MSCPEHVDMDGAVFVFDLAKCMLALKEIY